MSHDAGDEGSSGSCVLDTNLRHSEFAFDVRVGSAIGYLDKRTSATILKEVAKAIGASPDQIFFSGGVRRAFRSPTLSCCDLWLTRLTIRSYGDAAPRFFVFCGTHCSGSVGTRYNPDWHIGKGSDGVHRWLHSKKDDIGPRYATRRARARVLSEKSQLGFWDDSGNGLVPPVARLDKRP